MPNPKSVMGNPMQWTAKEEDALRAGILKYGAGKWKSILRDSQFKRPLRCRSITDLKDKWHTVRCCHCQGCSERSPIPKPRTTQDSVVPPILSCQTSAPALPVVLDSPADDLAKDDPSKDRSTEWSKVHCYGL